MDLASRHLFLITVGCAGAATAAAFLSGLDAKVIVGAYFFGGLIGISVGAFLSLCSARLEEVKGPLPNNLSTFSIEELEQLEACRLPVRRNALDIDAEGTFVRLKGNVAEVEWDDGGASLVPLKQLAFARRVG